MHLDRDANTNVMMLNRLQREVIYRLYPSGIRKRMCAVHVGSGGSTGGKGGGNICLAPSPLNLPNFSIFMPICLFIY